MAACGDEPADQSPLQAGSTQAPATPVPATTSTTSAGRTFTSDLTTTDGYRYTITVLVGDRSPTGAAADCPGTLTPGKSYLPVTLTVANASTDRAAPFPPVRVELTSAPGTKPGQVLMRDSAGACTFSPRQPSIGPGASAVFRGTSPAIDVAAGAGSAGQIEVKVSETTFSLAAPVP
ncbi:MAG: hypothetical protein ACR2KK_01490 [Acidimicrobiales bacterium]